MESIDAFRHVAALLHRRGVLRDRVAGRRSCVGLAGLVWIQKEEQSAEPVTSVRALFL